MRLAERINKAWAEREEEPSDITSEHMLALIKIALFGTMIHLDSI